MMKDVEKTCNRQLWLLVALFISFASVAFAQKGKTVSGTVKDSSGELLIGVSVLEAGTNNGTITNIDGAFSLTLQSDKAVLQFSYIGYTSQSVQVGGKSEFLVVMKEDAVSLSEVVVTGYGGSQKRATLTTAISKMDNAVLEKAAFSNAAQSLQGSVTGLRVTTISGQPGSSPDITLRGGATITGNNNKALIIVDGIIRDSMDDINPSDIESIQVLKDAASTAIYGARANGGVVLVQTKSGKEGKATVSYKFKMGMNFSRMGYDYLNARDYIYYNRMGYHRYDTASGGGHNVDTQMGYGVGNTNFDIRYLNDETAHLQSEGWQVMDDPTSENQILYRDHSGVLDDYVFDNPALSQDHYLNITGGNDKATFVASLGYYKEDGMIKGTGYKRFNGSLNGSYQVFPFLKVKAGSSYSYSEKPSLWISEPQMFYRTRSARPTWNPVREDGSPSSGFGTPDGNPAYYRDKLLSENGTRRQSYNIGFAADILPKKLVLTGDASLLHYDYQQEDFDKMYQTQNSNNPNRTREAMAYIDRYTQIQLNSTLTYSDTFADVHNLEVMLGGEYYTYNSFNFEARTQNSPLDDIPTMNVGATRTKTTSSKSEYRILSGFGRLNYNYNMRYLFSFVFRQDGISRLKDNRWGFFPGVSVGWNVTEEPFWQDSKISEVVSNLKPRLSYGVNGNVNGLGNYTVYGEYHSVTTNGTIGTTVNYNGQPAFYNSALINTGLRWEQSKTFEVGLDVGFFNNRLSFILDYYNRRTSNLLTDLALPGYTGFSTITTNSGTLRNSGFEAEVNANIFHNPKGFSWEVSANVTSVANKILELPDNGVANNRVGGYEVAVGYGVKNPDGSYASKWVGGRQEGGKLGEIVAYPQHHIFKDWDDVRKYANDRIDEVANLYGPGKAAEYAGKEGWKPIEPGDVCWEDLDGDGKITSRDKKVIGNIFPKVTGGFSTTFSFKDVSLYARFDYSLGHTLYNDLAARVLGQYQGSFNLISDVHKMWREDNTDTDLPTFYYADQLSKKNITRENNAFAYINGNSSRFYQKGDYLALRELTLNWNLPKPWIQKIGLQNAAVYVTGQNLFYITGYEGTSPEPIVNNTSNNLSSNSKGVDEGRYPTPRTLLFGLSLTF